jgi:FeS assembly SUF system protein
MKLFRRNRSRQEPPPSPRAEAAATPADPPAPAPEPPKQEPAAPEPSAIGPGELREGIIAALRTIYDPEIPINIYDLGLIYEIDVRNGNEVFLRMTLTSPNCPEAETLPGDVLRKVKSVPGVRDANVELVWDPPFTLEMMSEAARLQLNL